MRSAVVLGMVGTGGLGFQLGRSFQGLAYAEMWTALYSLLAFGAAAECWSTRVRRGGPARRRPTLLLAGFLGVVSWWHLRPSVSLLWSGRTVDRLARSSRGITDAPDRHRRRRARRAAARFVALLVRSVPPTVWALLALFVLFPGVVPGAVALGLYTTGVLARLFAEVLEHVDGRPRDAAAAAGAGRVAAFAYGSWPDVAPRWAAYSMYRWEVAARDAAVVGVVGVAGLGRLLAEQTAGFVYPKMTTTVVALVFVAVVIDGVSRVVRGWAR